MSMQPSPSMNAARRAQSASEGLNSSGTKAPFLFTGFMPRVPRGNLLLARQSIFPGRSGPVNALATPIRAVWLGGFRSAHQLLVRSGFRHVRQERPLAFDVLFGVFRPNFRLCLLPLVCPNGRLANFVAFRLNVVLLFPQGPNRLACLDSFFDQILGTPQRLLEYVLMVSADVVQFSLYHRVHILQTVELLVEIVLRQELAGIKRCHGSSFRRTISTSSSTV